MSMKRYAAYLFLYFLIFLTFFTFGRGHAQTSASQTLTLKPGFNFVSFTVQPSLSPQKAMEADPRITDIYSYSAATGSFLSAAAGELSSLVPGKGYIIKADSETSLSVSGSAAGTIGNITLKAGFNLIGISKTTSANTFGNLMKGYSVISGIYKWNAAAGSFLQVVRSASGAVEQLDGTDPAINAGQAYFIKVTADTTINYDSGDIIVGGQQPVVPVVKTLGFITLSRPAIAAAISSSTDLASAVAVSAVYTDGTSAAVSASWTVKSGGGSLSGTVYTAPSVAATAVLTATYSEGGVTKTADLTLSVQNASYTQSTENIAGSLAWKWTDPGSDAIKIESTNRIDITAPNGNDLYNDYNYDAPRYTKTVTGDFAMYVRAFPNSFYADYNGLGLVVEDPAAADRTTSKLRFEYGYNGAHFASMLTPAGIIGSKYNIYLHDIYLKLERAGNKFTGYARDPNVAEWTKVSETTMNLPATIDAGLILINQHNSSNFSGYFTDFAIYRLASAVSNSVSELTLSKTSDTATAGAAYDLSLITATAKYSDGMSKAVTPSWDVLIGSGTLASGKYTAPSTSENAVLRASYTENGVSASALFKLTVSAASVNIGYTAITERAITQPAADTVIDVNTGSASTDVACSVTVPANTLPSGAVVAVGRASAPVPMQSGIDATKITNIMPDIVISARSTQGANINFSGPIYLDIPTSRLGTRGDDLFITRYDGSSVKCLTGYTSGDKFRIALQPSYFNGTQAPALTAGPLRSPNRQIVIVGSAVLAIGAYFYSDYIIKKFDAVFSTESPGLIVGAMSAEKQNVLVIHGIFSQTKFLGAPDKTLTDFLTENGYNVLTFNYKYWESNYDNGVALAKQIMSVGNSKTPITVVCHSMGGLVTRWALNYLSANAKSNYIDKVVFLSTPNRGGKLGPVSLGDLQEFMNYLMGKAAKHYLKAGLLLQMAASIAAMRITSNLDNWPVGFLQLIGDKHDTSNFLSSLNYYIEGRSYMDTSYYAMIDNEDEFVDVDSIDFNRYSDTSHYPYSVCENFKNMNSFSLTAKNYGTGDEMHHSATHNISIADVAADMLDYVKKLKSLTVLPATAKVYAGAKLDLNTFSGSILYYNSVSPEVVTPQWKIKSGGGLIMLNEYTAPGTTGTTVLTASYVDKDVTATAEVTIDIVPRLEEISVDIGDGVMMDFMKIKAGTFTMGSPDSDTMSSLNEKPQHQVTITKDFYMGKYEVTQKQWFKIMGTLPSPAGYGIGDSYPVHKINSSDCFLFVSKLNAKNLGYGTFKLPTEAQWEYACRAGTTTPYYLTAADPMNSCGWYSGNSKTGSPTNTVMAHPVGQKTPNAFGLYDMLGNVGEFCSDMYAGASYTADAAVDPTGESGSGSYSSHVIRGGNFYVDAKYCRSASRAYSQDETTQAAGSAYGVYNVGLRIIIAQ